MLISCSGLRRDSRDKRFPSRQLKKKTSMSPEDFARFLEKLSSDAEEAGRVYTRLHRRLVGFFGLKGIADPMTAADEALDRAAIKIVAGAPVPDVGKYCLGFARNIAMERWRLEQRETSVFQRFIESLCDGSDEEIERIHHLLKPCFGQLGNKEQKLLLAYCQIIRGRARAEHRRRLAENMKTTVQGLRMHVTRLRTVLADCVRKRSNGSPAAF
jgi:hypothetical protein